MSVKSLPILPGVPTAMPSLVLVRYSTWSASLMCFANSLPMSTSFILNGFTSLRPPHPLISFRGQQEPRGRGTDRHKSATRKAAPAMTITRGEPAFLVGLASVDGRVGSAAPGRQFLSEASREEAARGGETDQS